MPGCISPANVSAFSDRLHLVHVKALADTFEYMVYNTVIGIVAFEYALEFILGSFVLGSKD